MKIYIYIHIHTVDVYATLTIGQEFQKFERTQRALFDYLNCTQCRNASKRTARESKKKERTEADHKRMDRLPSRERKNDEKTTDGRRGVWWKGEKGGEGREETRCTHTECSLMGEESVPGKQAFFSIETMDQAHYNFYGRSFGPSSADVVVDVAKCALRSF